MLPATMHDVTFLASHSSTFCYASAITFTIYHHASIVIMVLCQNPLYCIVPAKDRNALTAFVSAL